MPSQAAKGNGFIGVLRDQEGWQSWVFVAGCHSNVLGEKGQVTLG